MKKETSLFIFFILLSYFPDTKINFITGFFFLIKQNHWTRLIDRLNIVHSINKTVLKLQKTCT